MTVEDPPGSGEFDLPPGFVEDPPGSGEYEYLGVDYVLVETFPGSGEYELVASALSFCTYGGPLTDGTPATYGDGSYGLCGVRNVRLRSAARAGSNPVTAGRPFDPGCRPDPGCG